MLVRKIIPQSTVDGLGNRTAIFLQGCNIRCAYCHNPETQPLSDKDAREMTAQEVAFEVEKNIPFIRGITVSGGECMLQATEMAELFRLVKQIVSPTPLSCLIDSNGTINFALYPDLMRYTDGVMLDFKSWNEDIYSSLTKAKSNQQVKDNIHYLLEADLLTEIRITCLRDDSPIKTDVMTILDEIAKIPLLKDKRTPIVLQRFRPQGVKGLLSDLPPTSDEQMLSYAHYAESRNLNVRQRG